MNHCLRGATSCRAIGLSWLDMSLCWARTIPSCPATNRMSTNDEGRQQLSPREILPNTMKSSTAPIRFLQRQYADRKQGLAELKLFP